MAGAGKADGEQKDGAKDRNEAKGRFSHGFSSLPDPGLSGGNT